MAKSPSWAWIPVVRRAGRGRRLVGRAAGCGPVLGLRVVKAELDALLLARLRPVRGCGSRWKGVAS